MAQQYKYSGTIETVDQDEETVLIVKKHIIGILQLYIAAGVGMAAAVLLVLLMLGDSISTSMQGIIVLAGLVLGGLMLLILLVATYVYMENRLIITSKNITQILQKGIFHRQVSQLAMSNVEDVTSDQKGVFATLLNYGTLKIETAGEQMNFHFTYCPNAAAVAKQVLEARERFVVQPHNN